METLLSTQQVAGMLNIPVATFYGWRSRGIGPRGYRMGKHIRFRREDVDAWLEEHAEASA